MVGLVACRLLVICKSGLCIVTVMALLLVVVALGLVVVVMLCAVASLAADLILVRHDDWE